MARFPLVSLWKGAFIMAKEKLKRLFQIGIVVPDAVTAAKNFCALFALDEAAINIIDTKEAGAAPIRVHGQEMVAYSILAMVNVVGVQFEFVQPNGGGMSSQQEFLDNFGAGIQHICIDVANYDEMMESMEKMGGEILSAGGEGAYSYRYMDMRQSMGMVFEVYNDGLRDTMMAEK